LKLISFSEREMTFTFAYCRPSV